MPAPVEIKLTGDDAGAVQAIRKTESALGGLSKQVTLTGGLFRSQFSAQQIGAALQQAAGNVDRLSQAIGGLSREQGAFAGSMAQMSVSLATGNPFAALAEASGALLANLTLVVEATKDFDREMKRIGAEGSYGWLELIPGVGGKGSIKTGPADKAAANAAGQAIGDARRNAEAEEARKRLEAEQKIVEDFKREIRRAEMDETEFLIDEQRRRLANFKGTVEQEFFLRQAVQANIDKIEADAAAKRMAREQQEEERRQQLLDQAREKDQQRAAKRAEDERRLAEAQTEQHRDMIRARLGQLRGQGGAAQDMLGELRVNLGQAQGAEEAARARAMMPAGELIRQGQAKARAERQAAREAQELEDRIANARERQRRGGRLDSRQQAALDFAAARDARAAAEAAVKKQQQDIAKIEATLVQLNARLDKLLGN